ncbi:hypothetical protein GCM10022295_09180 [Streptomyces osmaniensis]|uniref:Uncharacterized protein n=1 Tax=Streptomyces osmaniensis TaxID=593134 RepID=A0ABP6VAK3_9ACTN
MLDRGQVAAEEGALDLAGGELVGGLDQLFQRGRDLDLRLLEERGPVEEELRVVDHPDAVYLAVDRVRGDVGLVEVVLDRVDDVRQVSHLTALDELDLRVELEDVRRVLGQQRGEELLLEVAAGDPLGAHIGLVVGLRVLLDRLLHAGLAVRVEVLVQTDARTGPAAAPVVAAARGEPAGGGQTQRGPQCGSAAEVAVARCRHGDVLVSSAAAAMRPRLKRLSVRWLEWGCGAGR